MCVENESYDVVRMYVVTEPFSFQSIDWDSIDWEKLTPDEKWRWVEWNETEL
jgi:hypothetical protein